jgi:undecaprenyl-diphosphatase
MINKEIFFIALMGALQIILEMIPISSSSHLFLAEQFFKRIYATTSTRFPFSAFEQWLHGETLLIIFIFFRSRFLLLLTSLLPLRGITQASLKRVRRYVLHIFALLFLSTTATFILYFPIKYATSFMGEQYALAQCIGMVVSALLLISSSYENKNRSLSAWTIFLLLGITQGCAALPGISRLGSTYAVGKIIGLRSDQAFYYSFLIHMPLCLGGFTLGSYKLLKTGAFSIILSPAIILALICASLLSYYALRFTYLLALKNKWYWLSIYLTIPFIASLILYFF